MRTRNKLVHERSFLSAKKNDWYGEYAFMIWLDLWLCADFLDTMASCPNQLGVSAVGADR